MIVGAVIVGAALLVLAALGMPFLLQKLRSPEAGGDYTIGDCVVENGTEAVVTECTAPNAYEIISRVATPGECPDPAQPTVTAGEDVFCLEPAASGEGAEGGGE